MTSVASPSRPVWLKDTDELPHALVDMPGWIENYLSYVHSPKSGVGVWLHLSHVPGEDGQPTLWDEVVWMALPGDRYLVTKAFGEGRVVADPGATTGEVQAYGLTFRCNEPFTSWTKSYRGAARLVTGEELRAGPIGDGAYVPVSLDLECTMMSPPFDYGGGDIEQSFAKAHYDQQQRATGRLTVMGETYEIDGTGLRDHSWGPRDWTKMGQSTWFHGQFPESGRSFMAIYVGSHPEFPNPVAFTVLSDGETVTYGGAENMPKADNLVEAELDGEFQIVMPDGSRSTATAKLTSIMRMCLIGDAQFAFGTTHRRGDPIPSHDYVPCFATVEWDGEQGIGYLERTIRLR
jgi:hypothetical protein